MTARALTIGLVAATVAYFGLTASAAAQAQRMQTPQAQAQGPGRLVARSPDLQPIASRIEHGAVSVRNTGAAASTPSLATVNCHLPGQDGGCPEIPAALVAPYENAAYPNRLVVSIPAIPAGHVHSHALSFWDAVDWPSGSYVFEFVVDAGASNGESNEGNNTGSHTWVVP
ncbi:MAG: hypothetical protein H7124_14010 [Phycisphaerales bacterium]|nr:hypothetical protein [Hyphomonadaceae bacterium]